MLAQLIGPSQKRACRQSFHTLELPLTVPRPRPRPPPVASRCTSRESSWAISAPRTFPGSGRTLRHWRWGRGAGGQALSRSRCQLRPGPSRLPTLPPGRRQGPSPGRRPLTLSPRPWSPPPTPPPPSPAVRAKLYVKGRGWATASRANWLEPTPPPPFPRSSIFSQVCLKVARRSDRPSLSPRTIVAFRL